jgi:hypothetical protein
VAWRWPSGVQLRSRRSPGYHGSPSVFVVTGLRPTRPRPGCWLAFPDRRVLTQLRHRSVIERSRLNPLLPLSIERILALIYPGAASRRQGQVHHLKSDAAKGWLTSKLQPPQLAASPYFSGTRFLLFEQIRWPSSRPCPSESASPRNAIIATLRWSGWANCRRC